jgi:hypothetical protein
MNSPSTIENFRAALDALSSLEGLNLQRGAETDDVFTLDVSVSPTFIPTVSASLASFTTLMSATFVYSIQNGTGSAILQSTALRTLDWSVDDALSPTPLTPEMEVVFEGLVKQLGASDKFLSVDVFSQGLIQLQAAGASVKLLFYLVVNKSEWVQQLAWPTTHSCVFYVLSDKLLQRFQTKDLLATYRFLVPDAQDTVLILLGDAHGIAEGPNIRILGRDQWAEEWKSDTLSKPAAQKIQDTLSHRREECYWDVTIGGLTPLHLVLNSQALEPHSILDAMARLRNRLSVMYLADRARTLPDSDGHQSDNVILRCEFRGHKTVKIPIPTLATSDPPSSIYEVFSWAYQEPVSDRIAIVRHVISILLPESGGDNFTNLLNKSDEILGVAKSNYQLALRKGVELYFDRRLKVSEFLQNFAKATGESVSQLGSDLVGNLYKTVGIILGVVVAALAAPQHIPIVSYVTSLLYFLYLVLIIFYLLPSDYWRFRSRHMEYLHNIGTLKDVLSDYEIGILEGDLYERARRSYLFFFLTTNIAYAILALVAYLGMQFAHGLL